MLGSNLDRFGAILYVEVFTRNTIHKCGEASTWLPHDAFLGEKEH
jgi:hypothetical protein